MAKLHPVFAEYPSLAMVLRFFEQDVNDPGMYLRQDDEAGCPNELQTPFRPFARDNGISNV